MHAQRMYVFMKVCAQVWVGMHAWVCVQAREQDEVSSLIAPHVGFWNRVSPWTQTTLRGSPRCGQKAGASRSSYLQPNEPLNIPLGQRRSSASSSKLNSFNFFYVHLSVCLHGCTPHVSMMTTEARQHSGPGVTEGCEPHCGARNWTWVLRKRIQLP